MSCAARASALKGRGSCLLVSLQSVWSIRSLSGAARWPPRGTAMASHVPHNVPEGCASSPLGRRSCVLRGTCVRVEGAGGGLSASMLPSLLSLPLASPFTHLSTSPPLSLFLPLSPVSPPVSAPFPPLLTSPLPETPSNWRPSVSLIDLVSKGSADTHTDNLCSLSVEPKRARGRIAFVVGWDTASGLKRRRFFSRAMLANTCKHAACALVAAQRTD